MTIWQRKARTEMTNYILVKAKDIRNMAKEIEGMPEDSIIGIFEKDQILDKGFSVDRIGGLRQI
jgi:hypothetical protein